MIMKEQCLLFRMTGTLLITTSIFIIFWKISSLLKQYISYKGNEKMGNKYTAKQYWREFQKKIILTKILNLIHGHLVMAHQKWLLNWHS